MTEIDTARVDDEVSSLALQHAAGDRAELAKDLKRLKASTAPLDQAIVARWEAYLRDYRANVARRDAAERAAEQQAAANAASAQHRRLVEDRAEQERALSPFLRDVLATFEARIAALEDRLK